jgi:phosphoglycerol transferase MdoB-like AlkP superfamily enzyme
LSHLFLTGCRSVYSAASFNVFGFCLLLALYTAFFLRWALYVVPICFLIFSLLRASAYQLTTLWFVLFIISAVFCVACPGWLFLALSITLQFSECFYLMLAPTFSAISAELLLYGLPPMRLLGLNLCFVGYFPQSRRSCLPFWTVQMRCSFCKPVAIVSSQVLLK